MTNYGYVVSVYLISEAADHTKEHIEHNYRATYHHLIKQKRGKKRIHLFNRIPQVD